MKKIALLSAFAISAALLGEARAAGWTLFWQDEFDGALNNPPDPAKWNIEVVQNPYNNELQYYTNRAKNVRLNGTGQLELTAYKENYMGKQYTSGRINTSDKFEQTYGYWEARIRLPKGAGLWPAFWLLGSNNGCGGWPNCGEFDIMEFRGRVPNVASSALHGPGYSGDTPIVHSHTLSAGPDFTAAYHTFGMEWNENTIKFYIDSVMHYSVPRATIEGYGDWVFNHTFHTLLNLAVAGLYDNNIVPADSVLPAVMTVDYVRVYTADPVSISPAARAAAAPGRTRLAVDLNRGQVFLLNAKTDGIRRNVLGQGMGGGSAPGPTPR